jgi:DNA helicase IV
MAWFGRIGVFCQWSALSSPHFDLGSVRMGDRAAVIAREQQAVDHAYACYEQKLAKNRGLTKDAWDVTDSEAGTSFIPETPPEIRYDNDLDGQALVVRRVDTIEDGTGTPRTYYIGRKAVHDSDGDIIVVSWQARIVKGWMLAKPGSPGEVTLRRYLSCDGRLVKDYSDELRIVVPEREAAAAEDEPHTELQGPERMRDFLLEDLERARDGKMRDIVETIRQEQFELVSDERDGLLVVQGGPGTGKTAVGLHRVSWLLYNEVFAAKEVLVVGPHRGFFDYISRVLPTLDIHDTRMVELDLLWADLTRKAGRTQVTDTLQAAAVKSDGRMADVLRRAVDNLVRLDALARHGQGDALRVNFEGVQLTVPKEEIASFAAPGEPGLSYQARRQRFTNALVDRLMHAYVTARPRQTPDAALRGRIGRHPQVAGLTHSIWPQLTAENLMRTLLGDPDTLRTAAAGILDDEEQKAIHRPQATRVSEEQWSTADQVCLEELRVLLTGEGPRRYRHIVVDEAQDLTPMQARSLARRCPSGSMTILGDLTQATGAHPYRDWRELAEILAGPDGWHLAELTVGYRVPDEIMRFAAPLAAYIAPTTAFPTSVRPEGGTPLRFVPAASSGLLNVAVAEALGLAATEADSGRSTALILPDDDELVQRAKLDVASLQQDGAGVLHVLSSSEIKGLEFDHVIVAEPAAIVREAAGLRRLYIAITRCTQSLTIVHEEPLPGILTGVTDLEQEQTVTDEPTPDVPAAEDEEDAPDATEAFDEFVSALEERVRVERECHVHERIRHLLIGELYGARLIPATNLPTIDIACDGPNGTILYEVLGEGGHTYERMREAALRMMEVQYAEGMSADHRFLVLPGPPAEAWAAEVLREAFGISIIWRTADGWEGHSIELALGGNISEDDQ